METTRCSAVTTMTSSTAAAASTRLTAGAGTPSMVWGVRAGGGGNDIYVFGSDAGQTIVKDNDWAFPSTDTVRMEAGITPSAVQVARDGGELVMRVNGSPGELRLYWWFNEGFGYEYQVQRFEFADGT